GLAQVVPRHPADLRSDLGRPELAMRLEQGGKQDGDRLDGAIELRGERRKLGPCQIGIRRHEVEVEPDRARHHAASYPPEVTIDIRQVREYRETWQSNPMHGDT